MKSYFSDLDVEYVRYVPQGIQHIIIHQMAERLGGRVTFYAAEEFETLKTQSILKAKLREKPDVDGIIFFRVHQFCYGNGFNLNRVKWVMDQGYEVHFALEQVSLRNQDDLLRQYPDFSTHSHMKTPTSSLFEMDGIANRQYPQIP